MRRTAALLGILIVGCAGPAPVLYQPSPGEPIAIIHLVSHGWHTGLVLRRTDIPAGLWPESSDFPEARYLEIGWGDWDFYQSHNPNFGMALKAVFWPTASVLHVVGFEEPVDRYFPYSQRVALVLPASHSKGLAAYIHNSFARNGAARATALGEGLYGESRFYPARGKFHLFNTCNVWTARALRAAGYPINLWAAISAADLMAQLRRFGTVPALSATD